MAVPRFPCAALLGASLAVFAAPAVAQVVSYHGVTAAAHQTQFTTLTGQGYRLVSLAVSGGLATARYTAVWEQVAGPAWLATHGLTTSQYTAWRSARLAQGYRAKLVSAAGSGSDTVFAAVFVQDGATVTDAHAYSESAFTGACNLAQGTNLIPVSVDVHGTATTPLYSVVFEPNTRGTAWGYNLDATHTEWVETYDAHTEADARLACLGMSDAQAYLSVWYDDRVGGRAVRTNYTAAGFGTQVTTLQASGYELLCVAAGGSGTGLRIGGSFATLRTPASRVMTTTGQARPEFAQFDTYMTNKMVSEKARAGSIAIAKDGRLVYARGYTWAEPGYAITTPTSLFRVASLAKVPTAMATHRRVADGPLAFGQKVQAVLGLGSFADARFDDVTIQHCLEYQSGLPRGIDAGVVGEWWWGQFGLPVQLPATRVFGESWLAQQTMNFTPGTYCNYANTAHFLLGQIVEQDAGLPLQTYLQNEFYTPLGITRARIAGSLASQLVPGEVRSHLRILELSESDLHSDRRRLSHQYAKDFAFMNASGGTAFSTVDYVRLLAGVFDLGDDLIVTTPLLRSQMLVRQTYVPFPGADGLSQVTPASMSWTARPNGVFSYKKGGTLSSASTEAMYRTDGVTIAVFFNQADAHADTTVLDGYVEAMTSWPGDDLFPSYGLPSFPRTPLATGVAPSTLPNVGNAPFVVTGERLDQVTAVYFDGAVILSQSPTTWQWGYYRILGPTQIEVHAPQGLLPGLHSIQLVNTSGSSAVPVVLTTSSVPVLAGPALVGPTQSFGLAASRGSLPDTTVGWLLVSTSNLPSSFPGLIDLGIGNGFAELVMLDLALFDPATRAAWWSLPPQPVPVGFAQIAYLDLAVADPWPPVVSNVWQVTRQ